MTHHNFSIFVGAANRLPALTETPDNNNKPYSAHSPRSSPQNRRSGKQRKFAQQSGDSGFSSKGTLHNPSLQQSVDSSFASTDADHVNRSQQLSSVSDNEPTSSRSNGPSTRPKQQKQSLPRNRVPPFDEGSDHIRNGKVDHQVVINNSWSRKNNEFDHVSKVNDTLSSNSSQEFIQTSFERNDGGAAYHAASVLVNRTKWNPHVSDADDSNSERENGTIETSFTEQQHQQRPNQHQQRNLSVRKETRPPSLSEVPLPPPSMLNETLEYEVEDQGENTSLISSSNDRKNAFQNGSRLRGTMSYADSTDSERQYLVENANVVTS